MRGIVSCSACQAHGLVSTVWDPASWLGLLGGDESGRSASGSNSSLLRGDRVVRSGARLNRGDCVARWLKSDGDGGLFGHGHG